MTETLDCFDKCERGILCEDKDGHSRWLYNYKTGQRVEVSGIVSQCPDNSENVHIDPERAGALAKVNERAIELTLNPIANTGELKPVVPEPPHSNHARP